MNNCCMGEKDGRTGHPGGEKTRLQQKLRLKKPPKQIPVLAGAADIMIYLCVSNKVPDRKPRFMPRSRSGTITIKPPPINGIGPSCITLPKGQWKTVFAFLEEYFPDIGSGEWLSRMDRGKIIGQNGTVLSTGTPYHEGMCVFYYRELETEVPVPFEEHIVHKNAHLVVADKPHFLPVIPSGPYLSETLLVRLRKRFPAEDIVPVHRIDKDTAGIVVFSCNRDTRALYSTLFREKSVRKTYEAIAPVLSDVTFPFVRRSRIVRGEPFFRMKETEGVPNSETSIDIVEIYGQTALYQLVPITGKKHQLRLHLSSLGIPIANDRLYPQVIYRDQDDFTRPLQLISRSLSFMDPITGKECIFQSNRVLSFRNGRH